MKIILKQDHENLGKAGELTTVKNGFARNFLIPQGIAVTATKRNIRVLEEELKMAERRKSKDKLLAESVAAEMAKVSLTAAVSVGEDERLFGSVTSQNIAELLKEKGFDIDKKKILLSEPIKALGIYTVSVKLHTDVSADVRIWVVKE